jgi:hypothetical protein
MLELLQSVSRVALALLSGAMLIAGFFFFADGLSGVGIGGYGKVWTEIRQMLSEKDSLYVFVAITAVVAYVLGIINVAGSSLLFGWLWKTTNDDWVLISRIEALQKPQLLKEVLDFLHIKRALVASFFPLVVVGSGLAYDRYEWKDAHRFRIATGTVLVLAGVLALFLAAWLARSFETITKKLSDEPPNTA